ncbi:bifunctional 5,10-methylene-tetrahydrofolate dehydrogenase/5,10-methylene-tetrahydrofolate cyclohydrolase [Oenococcus oeni]|uniref:bifunctional 5,10-methylenetetrahydrofolate dehydrogenase/5,10-methenyltetrahydrofolate cyclohydrolase n=1 Tax=Oenococcus oeni TaxID=1247 RepID=UPI0008F90565|nr:bifunctional 5,10-methylenetetrahydrofolate dehydrogenase/5,10-methenyltetrahydrofolate cyclohydrolase [Oenococcus oeni]OIL38224.1 bifunctional 5,10-methylene-tetrahydrofolate dehydrogenase/5,10-methylene-tetrahydrofolate cyclohydrolase [Oenococcus oeni]
MVQILDGRSVSKKILQEVKDKVAKAGFPVKLATIYNEENEGSKMYVGMKIRRATFAGLISVEYKVDNSWKTDDILRLLSKLNMDSSICGILVQSPLGDGIDESKIFNAIDPLKDADGLSAFNQGLLFENAKENYIVPATPAGVISLLEAYHYQFAAKNALVIGRSVLFGHPMSVLLTNRDMTVTLAHSKTPVDQLRQFAKRADLIVVAIGKANWFQFTDLKKDVVVIDVGANKLNGHATGDVDFEKVSPHVSQISPVPGGVGPMTIATLIKHTFDLAVFQQGEQK